MSEYGNDPIDGNVLLAVAIAAFAAAALLVLWIAYGGGQ